jgi:Protein of unknown function (DUF4232)
MGGCRPDAGFGRSYFTGSRAGALRAWALGVVLVAGLAGCTVAPPAEEATAPTEAARPAGAAPGPAVPCTAATLSVALGPSEGAAGTVHAALRFTNTGNRPCVTQGFPGVSYVTAANGGQVGRAADRDGGPNGVVTLGPGEVASASLAMVQVGNFDRAACQPTPVRALRVYPPGQRVPIFVPIDRTACAGSPSGPQLRIGTIKPGAASN